MPTGEDGDEQSNARPRRRVGVRGTYGIRGRSREAPRPGAFTAVG